VTRHALLAVTVLLLSACGGDAGSGEYAAEVCGQIEGWVDAINSSLRKLEEGVKGRATVGEEQRAVGRHLDDVEEATDRLIENLRAEPTAGVDGGDALSSRLVQAAERVQGAARDVRRKADALAEQGVEAFREGVSSLLDSRIGVNVRRLLATPAEAAEPLAEEFEEAEACQGLVGPRLPEEDQPGA
jgi:hypothetical protein